MPRHNLRFDRRVMVILNGRPIKTATAAINAIVRDIMWRVRCRTEARARLRGVKSPSWPYSRTKSFQTRLKRRIKNRVKWEFSRL